MTSMLTMTTNKLEIDASSQQPPSPTTDVVGGRFSTQKHCCAVINDPRSIQLFGAIHPQMVSSGINGRETDKLKQK